MTAFNSVNLDKLVDEFTQLEQKITEVNDKNKTLEIKLDDANGLMKFYVAKEKSLIEERDSLLDTVNKLQQTLQEQCNLRVENDKLQCDVTDLRQQSEKAAEDREAEVRRLLSEMKTEEERHKRELEAVRQRCRSEVELAHREILSQYEAKDAEIKKQLEKKDAELEEMKRRLRDQERERQSELLKLQMEFGAKLARVQSTAQWSQQQQQQQQQQQHGSSLFPQSVYKRKLQFLQEEKNKEIVALRQRIKELEEIQRASGLNDNRLKRRKI